MTKSYQLTKRLNKHISNSKFYSTGNSITWKQFRQYMKTYFPEIQGKTPFSTKDSLTFVTAYTRINKLLALRGLYMKSENYYTKFTIIEKDNTGKKVKDYYDKATFCEKAGDTLLTGFKQYQANWSPLQSSEIERISSHIYRSCTKPTSRY